MKQEIIKLNDVDIVCTFSAVGTALVPIKPICEALGIDAKAQRDGINNNPLTESTGVLITSVGADGKQREPLLEQLVDMPLYSNLRSLRIFCILAEEYQFYYRSKDADITQPMLTVPQGDRTDFHRLEVLLMELANQYLVL